MRVRVAFAGVVAASGAAVANAQLAGLVGGLSTNCTNSALGLLRSPFAQCAALTNLVSFLTASNVTAALTTYLDAVCTKSCTSADIQTALAVVDQGCAQDLSEDSPVATSVRFVIANFQNVTNGLCLESTANGTYCITQTISGIEQQLGDNVSPDDVIGLLSNASSIGDLATGELCTDCNKALVTAFGSVNGLTEIAVEKCGASFGDGQIPSTVSRVSTNSTQQPSGSASSMSPGPSITASGTAAPSQSAPPSAAGRLDTVQAAAIGTLAFVAGVLTLV
ncbi:hypothetical protein OIV83_000984 [Microbotryomycetes sp. JL201]|nr:hypothetical protein OIV83_000984 [Microbotryomycetes sp. JL201]